jgi:hypothetical protein
VAGAFSFARQGGFPSSGRTSNITTNMFSHRSAALVAALLLLFPAALQAQKPSLLKYATLVEDQGYGSIEVDTDDDYLSFMSDGNKVMLFLDDDLDFQLYAGFVADDADCGIVNLWNREHRFFRCYIDSDGDYAVEYDHLVSENATMEELAFAINFFAGMIPQFRDAIYD